MRGTALSDRRYSRLVVGILRGLNAPTPQTKNDDVSPSSTHTTRTTEGTPLPGCQSVKTDTARRLNGRLEFDDASSRHALLSTHYLYSSEITSHGMVLWTGRSTVDPRDCRLEGARTAPPSFAPPLAGTRPPPRPPPARRAPSRAHPVTNLPPSPAPPRCCRRRRRRAHGMELHVVVRGLTNPE